MKRRKRANWIMVLVIAVIAAVGISTAFLLSSQDGESLGSRYSIREIENHTLVEVGQEEHVCTMTIICDTILNNLDSLNEEKAPYVPTDGVVLPETQVSFAEGETAFDVLNRVCSAANLQIEYSWTPLYNTYYIEGINHLYEFDCGPESGWMYKVNDEFPNYGCSAYTMEDGDAVVWCYTCRGLGEDVGQVWMGES